MSKEREPLLPERHPVADLFVCDIFDAAPKADMASMEHPIFSLSTKPDYRTRRYEHNGNWIEVGASPHGLATVHDRDILIYCISQIMAAINKGLPVQRKLRVKAYDLLNATNRMSNGRGYEGLKAAFNRLQGTQIQTNIITGGQEAWEVFSIIEKARIVRETRDGRMQEVEVTLSDWVFNAIEAKEVLTLHKDYFRLRKPLERRMYELARKHVGAKHYWSIGLELLRKKTGSTSSMKEFKRLVGKIITDAKTHDHFPDFDIENKENNLIVFTKKSSSKVGQLSNTNKAKYTVDNLDQILGKKAFLTARTLAQRKNRDWYQLKSEFVQLLNNTTEERENISGSFIGFIKSKKCL